MSNLTTNNNASTPLNSNHMLEEKMSFAKIFIYGSGNFASQLSWTMVSTYLTVFYTNVFGLATGAVALLFLVTKLWDGIFDPIFGAVMERTHTRWGRFRPFIILGAPLLVIFTVLTFTVPNFSPTNKLIYAYLTYIGLCMAYSITNVPYLALPCVMTKNPKIINRLYASQLIGMCVGMIALNYYTLPLVKFFGHGAEAAGYQMTATIYALVALPLFLLVFFTSKEKVTVEKEKNIPLKDALKVIVKNKPLLATTAYTAVSMTGMFGRLGIAVFYYMYVVKRFDLIALFMMMQTIVGMFVMPLAPKIMEKLGKKNTCILAMMIQTIAMLMIFFGNVANIPFLIFSHVVYGFGYIAGPCGSSMTIDSIEYGDLELGGRPDGTAFAVQVLATKIATAIGQSLGIFLIGVFGYVAGRAVTPSVAQGINITTNLFPAICFALSIVPLIFYNLSDKRMKEIREKLRIRDLKTV